MVPTWFLAAVLTPGSDLPAGCPAVRPANTPPAPVYRVPGPTVRIPFNAEHYGPERFEEIRLQVSDNRGRTWMLLGTSHAIRGEFAYRAPKPGEYWFTAGVRQRDGGLDLEKEGGILVVQVEPEPPPAASVRIDRTAEAKQLTGELVEVELMLIRNEMKRLAARNEFDLDTAERIDRLHYRLSEVRERLKPPAPPAAASAGPWDPHPHLSVSPDGRPCLRITAPASEALPPGSTPTVAPPPPLPASPR